MHHGRDSVKRSSGGDDSVKTGHHRVWERPLPTHDPSNDSAEGTTIENETIDSSVTTDSSSGHESIVIDKRVNATDRDALISATSGGTADDRAMTNDAERLASDHQRRPVNIDAAASLDAPTDHRHGGANLKLVPFNVDINSLRPLTSDRRSSRRQFGSVKRGRLSMSDEGFPVISPPAEDPSIAKDHHPGASDGSEATSQLTVGSNDMKSTHSIHRHKWISHELSSGARERSEQCGASK